MRARAVATLAFSGEKTSASARLNFMSWNQPWIEVRNTAKLPASRSEKAGGIFSCTRQFCEGGFNPGLVFAKGASLGDFELLEPAVYVLAGLSVITTLQRIFHVRAAMAGA